MFILPGISGLVTLIFTRPFEFIEVLRGIPMLYIFFGLSLFGYLVDLRLGFSEVRSTPQLPWVAAFFFWCLTTESMHNPAALPTDAAQLTIAMVLYYLVAHGIRTIKSFEILAAATLVSSLWVAGVCSHQGTSPLECVAVAPGTGYTSKGTPDGRSCKVPQSCYEDAPDPAAMYRCEHAGLFGTTSIAGGRVRYLGILQDPNEVSLVLAIGLPLAFAFYQRRRNKRRLAVLLLMLLLVGLTVTMSKSRGGQLVFLTVIGVYFIEKFGFKGMIAGGLMGLPIMLLGGRHGAEAKSSSLERVECLEAGMDMFRQHPFGGVGFEQFTQHHYLTAHNSYVLAAAEMGIPGLLMWLMIMYLSIKIPVRALIDLKDIPEAEPVRIWALALIASMAGLSVGIFFLSFNYHYVLWLYLGLTGALYMAVKGHAPGWTVKAAWYEILAALVFGMMLMAVIFVYVRHKLG